MRRLVREHYEVYEDNNSNLWVHDIAEALTFCRSKLAGDKYELSAIIEEENTQYLRCCDILSPSLPFGVVLFDDINLTQWKNLVRSYVRAKLLGEKRFREWLESTLYMPLKKDLQRQSFLAESMPSPDDSPEDWQEFVDSLRRVEIV